jgi:protein ImuA
MSAHRAAIVEQLAEQLRRFEAGRWTAAEGVISTGNAALDRLLPEGGLRRGALVEWLSDSAGSGAGTLALLAAREALAEGGAVVVIDRAARFYPPAAAELGIELEKMIVVRPASEADGAWASDQALRSRGVAAAWCEVERPDAHTLRRWQLAAETSGVVGLLLRSAEARREPSWAELRLAVEPIAEPRAAGRGRRLRVTLLRSRAGAAGRAIEVEIPRQEAWQNQPSRGITHETRPVRLASQLAPAKTRRRARRA